MKKVFIPLLAGLVLTMASCTTTTHVVELKPAPTTTTTTYRPKPRPATSPAEFKVVNDYDQR